jgi:Glycosyl hydrolases family 39
LRPRSVAAAMLAAAASLAVPTLAGSSVNAPVSVSVNWTHVTRISRTVPTTQHLGSAYTLRGHPLNGALLKDLQNLHTNDTRVQLWYPLVHQAVAELRAPTRTRTFWNFRYMDETVLDFFKHTDGQHNVNVGTIPEWMFKTPTPVSYPSGAGSADYNYEQGTGSQLRDPSGRQFARYEARVFEWFTKGGFRDELGTYHRSGYHLRIAYWGVLNEPTLEHDFTMPQYVRIYDAVAAAIKRIDPRVQFIGPELSAYSKAWAEYFLNPRNHRRGTPLDWFSVHNYPIGGNAPSAWQAQYFTGPELYGAPSGLFAGQLRQLIGIRNRLSPHTKIALDELGTFDVAGGSPTASTAAYSTYNPLYWVASGANFAANFITAERLGISLISMTQMLGYPTQSESTTMVNWNTGQPNAHYWTLKLINENFGPGNRLVPTRSSSSAILAQAVSSKAGRKVLLVNTSDSSVRVTAPSGMGSSPLRVTVVDERSGQNPPRRERLSHGTFTLAPFATAVVSSARSSHRAAASSPATAGT